MIVRLSLNDQVCEIFTRSFSREKIDVKMFKFVSIRQQKKKLRKILSQTKKTINTGEWKRLI